MGLYLNYFCLYFQFCIAGWIVCNSDLMRITYCFVRHIKSASGNSQISYLLLGIIIFSWYNGATFSFFICCMLHGLKLSLFYIMVLFSTIASCLLLAKKRRVLIKERDKKEKRKKQVSDRFRSTCRFHVYVSVSCLCKGHDTFFLDFC